MSPAEPAVAFEMPPVFDPPPAFETLETACVECESLEERGIQVLLCRHCDHNVWIADRYRRRRLDPVG